MRKRKEREERRKKPPREPPVSFPSATWVCTIKSQYLLPGLCPLTACEDGHCGTQSDSPLHAAGLSPAAPSGRTQPDALLWRSGWRSRQQGRPRQTQAARAPAGKNRQSLENAESRPLASLAFYVAAKRVHSECRPVSSRSKEMVCLGIFPIRDPSGIMCIQNHLVFSVLKKPKLSIYLIIKLKA